MDNIYKQIVNTRQDKSHTSLAHLLEYVPFIGISDNGAVMITKEHHHRDKYQKHEDRIHLFVKVTNDGSGDYGHIYNYIMLFMNYGYSTENINIVIYCNNKSGNMLNGITIVKKILDDRKLEPVHVMTLLHENISMINTGYEEYTKGDKNSLLNINNFLSRHDPSYHKHLSGFHEKDKKIVSGDNMNIMFTLNKLKIMSYVPGVSYYLVDDKDNRILNVVIDKHMRKCYQYNVDKNDIIITFSDSMYDSFKELFNGCGKIIKMTEGGGGQRGSYYATGVGDKRLGIFNNALTHIRPDMTKDFVVKYLNEKFGTFDGLKVDVDMYHVAYVGQLNIKHVAQIIKFTIFVLLLIHMYLKSDTKKVHVFCPREISNYDLDLLFNKIILSQHPDIEIKSLAEGIGMYLPKLGINIYIIYFDRFVNRVEYLSDANDLTYQEFVKFSEKILATTGDLSYQESLILGKSVVHDYIDHKISMVRELLSSYEVYLKNTIGEKEYSDQSYDKQFGSIRQLYSLYEQMPTIGRRYDAKAQIKLNERIKDMASKHFDHIIEFLHNEKYDEFFNNIVRPYFNADSNFGTLIYLFRKNYIVHNGNDDVLNGIDWTEIMRGINHHGGDYYNTYVKTKQNYLSLSRKGL